MKNLKHLLCIVMVGMPLSTFAQATDLVIDNQTPGWLSSKINYGDQSTVRNLTVTGYINNTDLKFISKLTSNNLTGKIDLSGANVVKETSTGKDNYIDKNSFDASGAAISYVILPKSLQSISDFPWDVDTLVFDCNIKYVKKSFFKTLPCNLILGENVDSIPKEAFYDVSERLKTVHFSENTKYIGNMAFRSSKLEYANIGDLKDLEYLGYYAFSRTLFQVDTFYIPPKITEYEASAVWLNSGAHVFVHKDVKEISSYVYSTSAVGATNHYSNFNVKDISIHFESSTPPSFDDGLRSLNQSTKVYVPKGAKEAYLNSNWKNATIIEANPVERLSINEENIILDKDQTKQLSVLFTPSDADDTRVTWEVEDPTIACVDENGKVTALSPGTTNVIVTSVPTGVSASCTVTVMQHVTGITMDVPEIEFTKIGETAQLNVTVMPLDATIKDVVWTSSNPSVCSVTESGNIVALDYGTATILATTVDGALTATCVVKVLQHVNELNLNKSTLTLKVGESEKLQATVIPSNADNKNVVWTSSDENLATVDAEGNVTAVKAGQVTITVTSEDNPDIKSTCAVTVVQPVTGVTLAESTYTMETIGESVQLTATVLPEDASNKTVNWSSSNNAVCMVSNGKVVAVGNGVAVIIATSEDGGFMAYCTVTVKDISGIEGVISDKSVSGSVYDVMGRKIENPRKGQLYIKGGKKVIVEE